MCSLGFTAVSVNSASVGSEVIGFLGLPAKVKNKDFFVDPKLQ